MTRRLVDGQLPVRPKDADRGGAPSKLNHQLIENICKYIKQGNNVDTSAALNGIDSTTLRRWIMIGRKDYHDDIHTLYAELYRGLGQAEAFAETRDLQLIDTCGHGRAAIYERYKRDIPEKGIKEGDLVYDRNGNPILLAEAIQPDWRAVGWKMDRRWKKRWGNGVSGEDIMNDFSMGDNKEAMEREKEEVKRLARLILEEDPDAE